MLDNKTKNKQRYIKKMSHWFLIGALTASAILPGITATVTASTQESSAIKNQNRAVDDIAEGILGSANWRIDSSGTLHITEGNMGLSSFAGRFTEYASEIKKISFDGKVVAGKTIRELFYGLNKVIEIEHLSNLDTSNVTTMSGLFSGMSSLTSLDLSNFDTSKVTDMSSMFLGASSLTSLDLSNFDTSNVTTMSSMFSGMSSLNDLNISNFNTTKVTNMYGMFLGPSSLKELDLSHFDTSNVSYMHNMFLNQSLLSKLDVSSFQTPKLITSSNMFSGVSALEKLDLSGFETSNETIMTGMFLGMSSLSQVKLGDSFTFAAGSAFPGAAKSTDYTGKWINVATGTIDSPLGENIWSPAEMMANYNPEIDADTYVWQRVVAAEDVTVRYVDSQGEEIHSSQNISGNVGDSYDASTSEYKVDIEGYTLDESKLPSNATGVLNDVAQTVTYVYTKNPVQVQGGNVTVHYQDESGKSISDDVILKGNVGESYSSSKKDIKNYTFKEIKGAASGKFTDKAQSVTYVYKENSTTTTPSKQEVVNVYRLYNKKSMEHLYTADAYEYKHLPELSSDWVREGINFKEYKKSDSTTVTVHRVYNPKSGEHLNTTDSNEVKVLTSKGWKSEGVAFYAPKTGGKPVYRLFNPKAGIGAHFMTGDSYEKNVLTKAPKEWKYEGVAWNSVK